MHRYIRDTRDLYMWTCDSSLTMNIAFCVKFCSITWVDPTKLCSIASKGCALPNSILTISPASHQGFIAIRAALHLLALKRIDSKVVGTTSGFNTAVFGYGALAAPSFNLSLQRVLLQLTIVSHMHLFVVVLYHFLSQLRIYCKSY